MLSEKEKQDIRREVYDFNDDSYFNYHDRNDDYDFDYVNYNVTLRYEDKKLKIVSGESDLFREGMYLPALLPQIAIYPDAAFES